jgi:hypothetical protein
LARCRAGRSAEVPLVIDLEGVLVNRKSLYRKATPDDVKRWPFPAASPVAEENASVSHAAIKPAKAKKTAAKKAAKKKAAR